MIWNEKENRNKSGPLLDEFPGAKDFKKVKSWRVEYDENIHPVAINRNYNYNEKDNEIVRNILRNSEDDAKEDNVNDDNSSYKEKQSKRGDKSYQSSPKEKIIPPRINAMDSPSFLPWNDHGSSKASKPPACNCQRVTIEEDDTQLEEKLIFVVNPFLIGFFVTIIGGVFLL